MTSCKLLILGSGYYAVGMAMPCEDALICEESEFVDASHALTLKTFTKGDYAPGTALGEKLLQDHERLGLICDGRLNCSALEIGLSRFVLENKVRIWLGSRVISTEETENGYRVTVLTNGGLETVLAEYMVDARPKAGEKVLTLLFSCCNEESLAKVQAAFPEGSTERSFYADRGALHLPIEAEYNDALRLIYSRWAASALEEKILLFAPRFEWAEREIPANPIAAFEMGLTRKVGWA